MDDSRWLPENDQEKASKPAATDKTAEQRGWDGDLGEVLAAARPRLLRLAQRQGVADDALDDVVQETLVEAWRHLGNLRQPQHFQSWIDGICRNVCLRWASSQNKHLHRQAALPNFSAEEANGIDTTLEADFPDPLALDPAEELSRQDLPILLERALGYLSDGTREAVKLYYLAGIPQREVAQRMGLNIKALEVRLVRARRQLRQILSSELRADAEALGLVLAQDNKALYNRSGAKPGSRRISSSLAKVENTQMYNINLFDKFTKQAQKVVSLAGEEARQLHHNVVGSEHLLLGMIREGESVAARVLLDLGVTLEKVRKAVEEAKGRGNSAVQGEIELTAHANKVIEMAIKVADRKLPRTKFPLLGTSYRPMSEAEQMLQDAQIPSPLESLGVTLEKVSEAVEKAKACGSNVVAIQIETGMAPFANKKEDDVNWHHPLLHIDTEDMLKGLMRVPESTAVQILQGLVGTPLKDFWSLVYLEQTTTLQTLQQGYSPRFTGQARRAWGLAQEEVRRLQDGYIGGHHLLLGLVGEGSGTAASALASMGVGLLEMRQYVERYCGRGDGTEADDIKLTPHLQRVIEQAANEARRLNSSSIDTGHLLLALVRDEGMEIGLLQGLGVDIDKLRTALRSAPSEERDEVAQEAVSLDEVGEIASMEKDLQSRELDKTLLVVYPFTIEARLVLEHARNEARNSEQQVGPEHLLEGLAFLTFKQKGCVGKVLKELGIDFASVRAAVEKRQERGVKATSAVLVQTAQCRACLLLAADEAEQRGGRGTPIKNEHLLLGLLREEKGIIADLLGDWGTSVAAVRTKLLDTMSQEGVEESEKR